MISGANLIFRIVGCAGFSLSRSHNYISNWLATYTRECNSREVLPAWLIIMKLYDCYGRCMYCYAFWENSPPPPNPRPLLLLLSLPVLCLQVHHLPFLRLHRDILPLHLHKSSLTSQVAQVPQARCPSLSPSWPSRREKGTTFGGMQLRHSTTPIGLLVRSPLPSGGCYMTIGGWTHRWFSGFEHRNWRLLHPCAHGNTCHIQTV